MNDDLELIVRFHEQLQSIVQTMRILEDSSLALTGHTESFRKRNSRTEIRLRACGSRNIFELIDFCQTHFHSQSFRMRSQIYVEQKRKRERLRYFPRTAGCFVIQMPKVSEEDLIST